jgi:hypothetical protein
VPRGAAAAALDVRTELLSGRASITAAYHLAPLGAWEIRRRYEGSVSVDITLVSSRIERGIVAEFERSLAVAAACTQGWLDRVWGCHGVLLTARP